MTVRVGADWYYRVLLGPAKTSCSYWVFFIQFIMLMSCMSNMSGQRPPLHAALVASDGGGEFAPCGMVLIGLPTVVVAGGHLLDRNFEYGVGA